MADQPENGTTPTKSTDGTSDQTIFNSDIGEDWGEAFEAEDFMFSPDEEASSGFFLEDDSFEDSKEKDASSEELTTGQQSSQDSTVGSGLLSSAQKIFSNLKTRFSSAPVYARVAVGALPLCLLLFIMIGGPGVKQPDESTNNDKTSSSGLENKVAVKTIAPASPTKSPSPPISTVHEKVRKKWRLPSFLISAQTDKNNNAPDLLAIDITFILLLDRDQSLPESKEIFARELIYQFYSNRPLDELRRYSLARGEMNRKLRTWVEKQWPDIPLNNIVFDRYQIL